MARDIKREDPELLLAGSIEPDEIATALSVRLLQWCRANNARTRKLIFRTLLGARRLELWATFDWARLITSAHQSSRANLWLQVPLAMRIATRLRLTAKSKC